MTARINRMGKPHIRLLHGFAPRPARLWVCLGGGVACYGQTPSVAFARWYKSRQAGLERQHLRALNWKRNPYKVRPELEDAYYRYRDQS